MFGGPGDDTFINNIQSGADVNVIDGGSDIDTMWYQGTCTGGTEGFSIARLGPQEFQITGNDKSDHLIAVEYIKFCNGVPLDLDLLAPPDSEAPVIDCQEADGLWHATNVSLSCAAQDTVSGLAEPTDAAFSLTTSVPAGQESANAFTNVHQVCDNASNCANAQVGGNMIDRAAPFVGIAAPLLGASFTLGQVVLANFACQDNGSGVASCAGPVTDGSAIDTAAVGPKTFNVTATDFVGNITHASAGYTVSFAFTGFFSPVDSGAVLNAAKAGSAIPLKFSLGGNFGLNVIAAGYPRSVAIACDATAPVDAIEETVTAGSSGLSYDAAGGQYKYTWKSEKSWTGCRQFVLLLTDGSMHTANFKFAK
jgi:hypothetical protein